MHRCPANVGGASVRDSIPKDAGGPQLPNTRSSKLVALPFDEVMVTLEHWPVHPVAIVITLEAGTETVLVVYPGQLSVTVLGFGRPL